MTEQRCEASKRKDRQKLSVNLREHFAKYGPSKFLPAQLIPPIEELEADVQALNELYDSVKDKAAAFDAIMGFLADRGWMSIEQQRDSFLVVDFEENFAFGKTILEAIVSINDASTGWKTCHEKAE